MTASKIEWCDRSDWNPIRGCTRSSEGCRNCYAERIAARFSGSDQPFHGIAERAKSGPRWTGKVELIEERLTLPLRWRKPARIFVNSMFDLFAEQVPDKWIDRVFAVMALAPQHTFLLLTKRAARMRRYITAAKREARVLTASRYFDATVGGGCTISATMRRGWPQVWLGVSVEDQARADERIPDLLATPAAVHFLSCEPLLGPLDLTSIDLPDGDTYIEPLTGTEGEEGEQWPALDWVIAGGESGPGARPMHPNWARSLRDQCQAAGVPFFFKQWGEWVAREQSPDRNATIIFGRPRAEISLDGRLLWGDGPCQDWIDEADLADETLIRVGKKAAGRLLDGREHNEVPA